MTQEELQALVEASVKAVLAGMQGQGQGEGGLANGNGGKGNRRLLDPKGVSCVDTLQGKEGPWREWAVQFKVANEAMGSEVVELVGRVGADEDAHGLGTLELEFFTLDVTRAAGELYDQLCLCLKGDPLILVQGVTSID